MATYLEGSVAPLPILKHGGETVTISAVVSWLSAGPMDDNAAIYAAGLVQLWVGEHNGEVKYLSWPVRSPNFNVIEPSWSIFESSIRNRYHIYTSISSRTFPNLREKWYNILLNTIQPLYESSP
ncbi:hypothetical protein TNCV_3432051 [Trichonephila clavipes]|nr:hypothetical protein TNCV_3432051 [Trichonephila clavipes]